MMCFDVETIGVKMNFEPPLPYQLIAQQVSHFDMTHQQIWPLQENR